jgi:hypothetical protein
MKSESHFWKVKFRWIVAFVMLSACVERIDFEIPSAQLQTVVEGMISDKPGPYIVKISKGLSIDADSSSNIPLQYAKVKLYDDEGNEEDFTEINPGEYKTNGLIQGTVGHAYYIRIETVEGQIFESEPDRINPVGEVENIRYEFETRTTQSDFGEIQSDVFNIFVDSDAGIGDENYVRWKFKGTYKVETNPELHLVISTTYTPYKDPLPCSGYIIIPALGGGKLLKVGDCECCTCWVNQFEQLPQLSDEQLISDGRFKNVKVGEVPINVATFFDKYLIEVEQMSLSRKAFEFFKLIRAQKEGASSLFQPPSGEIKGNVRGVNNNESVIGLFWASSVRSKSLFIQRSEVPYLLPSIYFVPDACNNYYSNASTNKPALWTD